jgi:hypothetical protein
VGSEIPRATFDPEWALDDPDVTLLDVGHPLVRRLIEEVKQRAFAPSQGAASDHYGRTAYVVTPDVAEVTALFHVLARYVVNTDPTSIIEELLPVAVPVYRMEPAALAYARAVDLADVTPSAQTRTRDEVREILAEALAISGLNHLLADAVEDRRAALVAERRTMAAQMRANAQGQPVTWLEGIDDLARGTFDLLTVTVLVPG